MRGQSPRSRAVSYGRVPGPEPPARQLAGRDVSAADFDDYENVTLVDATCESGDAVASPQTGGWILFRDAELDVPGRGGITLRVARTLPGRARVEVWRASPGSKEPRDGVQIGQVTVNSTGGDYAWAEATAALTVSPDGLVGRADLYLVLHGELRLRSFVIE